MAKFQYKYYPEHLHYMYEQVWECRGNLDVYSDLSILEYEQTKVYIGAPKVVMDLGCGLGRAAIYMNYVLQNPDVFYILADRHGDTSNIGGWDLNEYYNNLDLTDSFCRLNGLNNIQTFDTSKDWAILPQIDLIMSHCAFGMHIPIESVMPQLLRVLKKDGTMIFGTRNRGVYSKESFKEFFDLVTFLEHELILPYPQQDWLILQNRK